MPLFSRRERRHTVGEGGAVFIVLMHLLKKEERVVNLLCQLWREDRGQDVAEYAVMLAVILVIVVGTVQLIGANANNVFSQVASSINQ